MESFQVDERPLNGFMPSAMPSQMPLAADHFSGEQSQRGTNRFMESDTVNGVESGGPMAEEVPSFDVSTTEPGGPQSKAHAKLEPEMYVEGAKRFPRISKPVELLRPEYDVVVIGSGYGGGVAASRMARAGQSVCLLELGKERWPGEYPSNLWESVPQVHVSGEFALDGHRGKWIDRGDPTGLYHLVVGEGQNAFVGNGLGGTSLLNANVCLRADERTLQSGSWPPEIRKIPGSLDRYYERAESVLEPTPYPENFPELPKLNLLKRQAEALGRGGSFYRVPQTTRFENGPNSTGVEMQASALTGQDSTGVNDGSKSSTLVNYLSDAWNWGAEMFCECEVRYIKKNPKGQGYFVYFAWHGAKRASFRSNFHEDLMWVKAKKAVFLGAGTLGTTEILLRSHQMGLPLSKNLGTGMSGNGDILAFGYNTDHNVCGMGKSHPDPEHPIGPTITGVIDCRDPDLPNVLDGYVIEEGAVPEALAQNLRLMLERLPGSISPADGGFKRELDRFAARQRSRFLGPHADGGSLQRTQTYLVMSHDSNQAIMTLKEDKPVLKFLGVGRSDHVKQINATLAEMTGAVGGTYVDSPFYAAFGQQEITVHPIGGANMSSDGTGEHGVTNHLGEVFTGSGTECHDGLVCIDASVIPMALGVNPFDTLTALAERSIEGFAQKRDIQVDYETTNGTLNLFGQPAHPLPKNDRVDRATKIVEDAQASLRDGLAFTEIMEGYMYLGSDIQDFKVAEKVARGSCTAARFFLSVHAWDTEALVSHNDHSAMLTGTFTCGALSRDPFMVLQGTFRLFNEDPRMPDTKNLTYQFDMISTDGETIHFHGQKIVNASAAFSPLETWRATSTLYVTLSRPNGSIVGRGVLHIRPRAFVSELTTFSPQGVDAISRVRATTQFLTYFSKQVAGVLLAPFRSLQWPTAIPTGYYNKRPPAHTFKLTARDGVQTTLQMWEPGPDTTTTPRVKVLLVPGAAVDHQIFAMPTIEHNAVEYFQKAGYQLFCVTHRTGKTMVAQEGHTTYDVRLDIKAALEEIRRRQNSDEKIYVVAHCAGSVALSMGLLDGTIPAEWIKGITASNVFMNPKFGKVNYHVASLPLSMTQIYRGLIGKWFACASSTQDSYLQQVLNQATRFYPVGSTDEICNSVTCHRSELVFGRLWTHRKLNEATHANLSKFLGGTSMNSLEHLMEMGIKAQALNNDRKNLVTPRNVARLAGIPILLFSGSENVVFTPESTDKSYSILRDQLGAENYERHIFQGRGHLDCWMGADAYLDVYPRVERHIEKTILRDGRRKE